MCCRGTAWHRRSCRGRQCCGLRHGRRRLRGVLRTARALALPSSPGLIRRRVDFDPAARAGRCRCTAARVRIAGVAHGARRRSWACGPVDVHAPLCSSSRRTAREPTRESKLTQCFPWRAGAGSEKHQPAPDPTDRHTHAAERKYCFVAGHLSNVPCSGAAFAAPAACETAAAAGRGASARVPAAQTACGVAGPVWHLPPQIQTHLHGPEVTRLVVPRPCAAREAVTHVSAVGWGRARTAACVR